MGTRLSGTQLWLMCIEGRQWRLNLISFPRWVFLWLFCSSLFYRIDLGPLLQLCQKIFETPVLPAFISTYQIGFNSFELIQSASHVSLDICEPSKCVQTLYVEAQLFITFLNFLGFAPAIIGNSIMFLTYAFTISVGCPYSASRIAFSYPSSVNGSPSISLLTCLS